MKTKLILVEGGSFKMGCDNGYPDKQPIHEVEVSSFYIGKYPVTFSEYDAYCRATGNKKPDDGHWGRGKRPVIYVSWEDSIAYCKWLSSETGHTYRLPTEAEWEYAARGGNLSKGYEYSGSKDINEVAWHFGNSGEKTHPVGEKLPNELGIHDMTGNVFEWCNDWYSYDYYKQSPRVNPTGPSSGTSRMLRGGSWRNLAEYCRVAFRFDGNPACIDEYLGFRVVRDI